MAMLSELTQSKNVMTGIVSGAGGYVVTRDGTIAMFMFLWGVAAGWIADKAQGRI